MFNKIKSRMNRYKTEIELNNIQLKQAATQRKIEKYINLCNRVNNI